jgi:DNA-binding beta-propeller fold protein YncE
MKYYALLGSTLIVAVLSAGCSDDDSESTPQDQGLTGVDVTVGENVAGRSRVYVLSEGGMGSNNSTLDFMAYADGRYRRNVFGTLNPGVTLGLGDTGNDLQVCDGETLWAVMTGSDLIEVMDASDCVHKTSIKVPTPRKVTFADGWAYVSSYNSGSNENGKVYRIDTDSFKVVDSVLVGPHPEGLAAAGGKLYVTNSYRLSSDGTAYEYLDSMDVINLDGFEVSGKIEVAPNLSDAVEAGGKVFVGSIGDYASTPSSLWCIDPEDDVPVKVEGVLYSRLTSAGDDAWLLYADYSGDDSKVWRIPSSTLVPEEIAFDGLSSVSIPYGIGADEKAGYIYIGDAVAYTNVPGYVNCFSMDGDFKWKAVSGIFPGHFAFY